MWNSDNPLGGFWSETTQFISVKESEKEPRNQNNLFHYFLYQKFFTFTGEGTWNTGKPETPK